MSIYLPDYLKITAKCAYYRVFAPYENNPYNALNRLNRMSAEGDAFLSKYPLAEQGVSWQTLAGKYGINAVIAMNQLVSEQAGEKEIIKTNLLNWCKHSKDAIPVVDKDERMCNAQSLEYHLAIQAETANANANSKILPAVTTTRDMYAIHDIIYKTIVRYKV